MIIRLPSHMPPTELIELGDIKISSGPRVNFLQWGSGGHTDSIDVEVDRESGELKEWLKFHCFVTSSDSPIDYYIHEKHGYSLETVRDEPQSPRDYSDFLPLIYWRHEAEARKLPKQSYTDLYSGFIGAEQSKKDLVTAYLLALTASDDKPGRKLFDRTYWRVAQYFSIIDSLIGQPTYCSNQLSCNICGGNEMPHHAISATKYVKDTIASIVADPAIAKHYQDIILTARNEIRHVTVHAARLPDAPLPLFTGDFEQRHYGTKEALEKHKKDAYALQTLEGKLEEVTRHLIMNHIYGHGIFEPTRGLSAVHMRLNTLNKKGKTNKNL